MALNSIYDDYIDGPSSPIEPKPKKRDALAPKFAHFIDLGIAFGAVPESATEVRVAVAWLHPSDQYSRKKVRTILSGRLTHLPPEPIYPTDTRIMPLRLYKAIVGQLRAVQAAPFDAEEGTDVTLVARAITFPAGRVKDVAEALAHVRSEEESR